MALVTPSRAEQIFTYGAPQLSFGPGASKEIGHALAARAARRVLVVTDPGVLATGAPERIAEQIRSHGIDVLVYARAHVEPTDVSLEEAGTAARATGPFDAVVAVGGGSSIDTAKAIDLLLTNPGEVLDYVNAPVGLGRAPEHPLLPLIAVPTTTGTGSESTTVCVLDVVAQRVKAGISHPFLRPTAAVVDPELTLSQPAGVTASSGMDVVCHALESYTARPYTSFEHKQPGERVPYCGANPIADLWSERALGLLATSLRAAVCDGDDLTARTQLAMASTFAGMGFGNAGVHLPHANAYPIAGQVRDFHPRDYPGTEALVPHGMAVALTAPEAFRLTFAAAPDRHVRAAGLLDPSATCPDDTADFLPSVLTQLMRDIAIPPGIGAVGYGEGDVESLAAGTMKQQRLLATAPCDLTVDQVAAVLTASIELW